MQRRLPQAPLTVDMLSAECKVVRLHEKPSVSMFKSSTVLQKASLLYTAKQAPRANTNAIRRNRKRTPSPNKSVLHDGPSGRSLQNLPVVRKSYPANGNGTGDKLVRSSDLSSSKTTSSIEGNSKITKVFLSEKQSKSLRECGVLVPGAPPATPTPEYRQKFDIIPSLAQRHMRQRLEGISKSDQTLKKLEKKREEQMKLEKTYMREKVLEMKRRQRSEIYALNRIMTDLEYSHFEQFVKERGYNE
ncbi:hypothetical protein BaRGS_00022657 [Batillaria attramentaria]|uniref:Small vasohibin-binding protein n=1 Tax=Batillaria attramentaria TaxID=370345 RepID=A0ABD0KG73_9CAEN